MSLEVKKISDENLRSAERLKEVFLSPKYRVSTMVYDPGTQFSGSTRSGIVYVHSGSCKIRTSKGSIFIDEGHYLEFPEGDFDLKVVSKVNLCITNVWNVEKLIEENT